tara:strand:+ start:749 stop:2017 length:1269 start_codon:yes stop_codon:yes gene_type:complete
MGSIEYYQTTMTAQEAVSSLRAASELRDEWLSLGIEERFQRELSMPRVEKEIAPYFATDEHRFISSLVVLIRDPQEFGFEPLDSVVGNISLAYRGATSNMGFLTVAGGENIILDGQHRHAGIRMAIQADFETLDRWIEQRADSELQAIQDDDISVIFIKIDDNEVIRKIFNKINKHAKKTSTADDIITNMDDGASFVTRKLISPNDGIMGDRFTGARQSKSMVNWRSNTVSSNTKALTHLSNFHSLNNLILKATGNSEIVGTTLRPSAAGIDAGWEVCNQWWSTILNGVSAYKETLDGTAEGVSPALRTPESTFQLLFLPVGQWAMVKALTIAVDRGQNLEVAVSRLNSINFSSDNDLWTGLAFKTDGKILRNQNYKNATAETIAYMIGSEYMSEEHKMALLTKIRDYKDDESLELPDPVSS